MKHIRYSYAAGRPIQSVVNGPRPIVMVVHASGRMWFFRDGTAIDDDGKPIAETTYELKQVNDDFGGFESRIVTRSRFELLVDGEIVATGDRCIKIPGRKRMVEHCVFSDAERWR